jgi:AcrR family transcriptional regulator
MIVAAPSPHPERAPRERLLSAMRTVLAERGYNGTTVNEVVSVARLSKRTFYEHFSDREDCFLALYAEATRATELIARGRPRPDLSWREEIEVSMREYFTALASTPMLTRAFTLEIATISPRSQQVRRIEHERTAANFSESIRRASQRHPEVPCQEVTPLMASALVGGITELILRAIERNETDHVGELVDVTTNMIWSVITSTNQPQLGAAVHDDAVATSAG